jgi:hypothetical protein
MIGRLLPVAALASLSLTGPPFALTPRGVNPGGPADAPGRVLYGVTVDRIGHLPQLRTALASLPQHATVRVVFDRSEPASDYVRAVRALSGVSSVMGELLDSSAERSISASQTRTRTRRYVHALGRSVSIWEVGNELNGNWTGPYAQVAAKTRAAFSVIHAAGDRSVLTLYANDFAGDHCGDGAAELTPAQFAKRYLSARLRSEIDYLLLSYYPTQCHGVEPTSSIVAGHLQRLHELFPNARLGFGEVGLPHPVTRSTLAQGHQIMRWAYSLHPGPRYYAGGYFWWYGAEDALHADAPLRKALGSAFRAENAALIAP